LVLVDKKGLYKLKTKPTTRFLGVSYSFIFLSIFLGSLLFPFVTVSGGLTGLLDGFRGKTRLINANTESRLALGDQVFNRTIVGHDAWLTFTDGFALTSYQNVQPFSTSELNNIQQSLENFRDQVQADGSVFLVVIAPDKQSVYPEHVPVTIPRLSGPTRLDQLVTQLANSGGSSPLLDLRPVLLEAKKTYPVYYATDSHWTPVGAFFAYQTMIETLQASYPNLSPHLITDYNIVTSEPVLHDMPGIIGSKSLVESPISLVPKYQPLASIATIDVPSQWGPLQLYFSRTEDPSAPTALVFYDSFFPSMLPFVAEHFSRAIYINYVATPQISYITWYKQFQPDIVIFEFTERNIYAIPELFGNIP
jgi:alginate O-acetyltransferase complex protein AlgJ